MDKENTIKRIFNQIVQAVQAEDFEMAQNLRLQLFDIDCRAVKEIFESGLIIERAKKEYIDKKKFKVFLRSTPKS